MSMTFLHLSPAGQENIILVNTCIINRLECHVINHTVMVSRLPLSDQLFNIITSLKSDLKLQRRLAAARGGAAILGSARDESISAD